VEIKMALKDSFGIWKENVYMHKSPNACSTVKQLLGKAWPDLIHGYGYPTVNCPIPPVRTYFFSVTIFDLYINHYYFHANLNLF